MKLIKIISLLLFVIPVAALAEGPEPTPAPQIVEFQLAPTPTPTPPDFVYEFQEEITEHDLDQEEVNILARLLWSSPLAHEDYKRQLCWVVFNRIEDEGPLFGRTIDQVVIPEEFAFYDRHAHVSETNERIAREELNRWLSSLDGGYVERPIPRQGLYIRFAGTGNRQLEVTAVRGGDAL